MPALRLVGLVKQFGDAVAVAGVDLDLREGEFFCLLGPSGCGKTTTLRLVAGLEEPTAGRIWLGDTDLTPLPPHRRALGMVFQNYALFPHLDVAGNVAYGLRSQGVPVAEYPQRVAAALAQVALDGMERRRVTELSGGQQQRVAVARATVLRPPLLLLDEPLSNLDARLRVETRTMLRRVQRELGATALYVTHDQDEALTLADRLAVMRAGRVEQVGTPQEVYNTPANAFVATFLGRANLVPATVVTAGDGGQVQLSDGLTLAAAVPAGRAAGEPVTLCLRPEALRLGAGEGVAGRVTERTFQGPVTEYGVDTRHGCWRVSEPNQGSAGWAVGEPVVVAVSGPPAVLPAEEKDSR